MVINICERANFEQQENDEKNSLLNIISINTWNAKLMFAPLHLIAR